ncbi:MAG: hypothetical protein ABJA37_09415, partial [Ferruginibacter sp.]
MKKILLFSVFNCLGVYGFCQTKDETAIKQLLEKESATWRSGDIKGHADCWYVKPYSRILVSTGDSTVLDVPPELMINPPANIMGKGGTSINSDYRMSVSSNNAWVSHNEESTAADGKKSYSYEIRILEKINGDWKLVGQSIHIYKPR